MSGGPIRQKFQDSRRKCRNHCPPPPFNREGAACAPISGDRRRHRGSFATRPRQRLGLLATDLLPRAQPRRQYWRKALRREVRLFRRRPSVNHFNYFANRPTRERLELARARPVLSIDTASCRSVSTTAQGASTRHLASGSGSKCSRAFCRRESRARTSKSATAAFGSTSGGWL